MSCLRLYERMLPSCTLAVVMVLAGGLLLERRASAQDLGVQAAGGRLQPQSESLADVA